MSTSPSDASRQPLLGALLRLAVQVMTEQFSEWLAASKFEDIQPAHSAAIQPLWELPEGARITTLARISRMTKQSMSTLVSDLEAAGYVERMDDPDDARAARVRLTAKGRAYGRAVRAFARGVEAQWAKQIGDEPIEQLRGALERLRETVFLKDQ
jgi:DNA-binding MarR family transcriptional regulator